MRLRQLRALAIFASLLLTGVLATTASAQTARYRHTTSLLPNGNGLIVGGTDATGGAINTTEIFIATTGAYFTADTLQTRRASHTATVLPDGRVLVVGGCVGGATCMTATGDITTSAEVYDPRINTWTAVGSLTQRRLNHSATLMPDGNVLISGGQITAAGAVTNTCEIFTPADNLFTTNACANMALARAGHTSTLLHTGRVFIAGGYQTDTTFIVTTELYQSGANTWSAGPALISKRGFHTATQMGNQKVLIVGGINERNSKENHGLLESVEIYDASANSVSPAAAMDTRRAFHTASLRPDGRVSVFGGLANITTSYVDTIGSFETGARLVVTADAAVDATGSLNPVGSTLTVTMEGVGLSKNVNGRITNGDVFLSSPNVSVTGANFFFPWPDGNPAGLVGETSGPLTGRLIDDSNGGLIGTISFSAFNTGIAIFEPVDATPDATPTPSVQMGSASGFVHGNVPISGNSTLTNGSIRIDNLVLPVPDSAIPGVSVFRGKAQILTGTSIDATTATGSDLSFTIDLTTGSTITGGVNATVSQNADGDNVISLSNLTFTNLGGVVNNSTDSVITQANTMTTLNNTPTKLFAGGTIRLFFTFSPVNVEGRTFNVDKATIVVRNMLSGDVESYIPYDPNDEINGTNIWSPITDGVGRMGSSSLLLPNGDEFFFGGLRCSNETTCGSPATFIPIAAGGGLIPHHLSDTFITWEQGKPMTRSRSNHSATLLPDKRLLTAGGTSGNDVVAIAETYNRTTDAWSDTLPMNIPRSHHTATLLPNGTVLVTGGFTTAVATGATNSAEIFYPETNSWALTAQMTSSRSFHSAMVLPDGNVLIAGGFTEGTHLDSAEIYYSTMHVWVPISSMDTERAQHTISMLRDGRVMVSGGVNSGGVLGNLATTGATPGTRGNEIYDHKNGAWTLAAAMNDPRHSHSASVLHDGSVLVAGGNDGFGEINKAELYNPTLNTWARTSTLGNDMLVGRLNHTATLLPNNKVYLTGGFTALQQVVSETESFDVAFSSWGSELHSNEAGVTGGRGDHTVTLLTDQTLIMAGGQNKTAIATRETETISAGEVFDFYTLAGGSPRRPDIVSVDVGQFLPGQRITLTGNQFKGHGEAAGGAGGTGNSSQNHPRLAMQRIGGSGIASSSDAGLLLDLSSGVFHNQLVTWANIDSSMTVALPETDDELPMGWYGLRILTNAQFSDAKLVQVAPAKPVTGAGIPSGSIVGVSSVSWSWSAAQGTFDGYNVYSATNGVFISTLAASGGATETFIQRNLGPDTSTLIKVAPYTLGGDGPLSIATAALLTPQSSILNLIGSAQTTQSIFWAWSSVGSAISYELLRTTSSEVIGTSSIPSFTQTALSTNVAYGLRVRALMEGGPGDLSGAATAFTLAALPVIGSPPVTDVSTRGFTANWNGNSNPPGTIYVFRYTSQLDEVNPVEFAETALGNETVSDQPPNILYNLEVKAKNGNDISTAYVSLGSTVTLAAAPETPTVTENTASQISVSWGSNNNHELTQYQILYSSDNFANHFATHSTFGSNFFGTTATITSLITGQPYSFRISAYDQFGRETSQVSTNTVTDNGGGPAGSIAFNVPRSGLTLSGGTLEQNASGNRRFVGFRIPNQTFDTDTRVFVSTLATLNCGNIDAGIEILPVPAIQPQSAFEVSLQYFPGEANLGSLSTLALVRWDPASGTCVPLDSVVDQASNRVTAQVNHLSQFQLMQLTPASSIANARVFPNPLYKSRQGFFTFDKLPASARIRIFTITGGEVFDGNANASGVARWDAMNKARRPVGSGVYIAVIEQGGSKEKLKLVVIR